LVTATTFILLELLRTTRAVSATERR
jgi:hypothetical protein